ncbi:MAG: Na+/H+ antiporter NhaA [Pseudoclavibacter sp.]|nr:Na+/H+ antiporter NhaA [Pseudoclavibacter sp.]
MSRIKTARPHRPDDTFSLKDRLNSRKVGGSLLLVAAVVAFGLANSPLRDAYEGLRGLHLGVPQLGLDLSLEHWAADGVLAIFFFVVGIELKREFVTGSLRDVRKATLPIAAAIGGMAVPALVFVAFAGASTDSRALQGWAVPIATDIAFALALLAVFGKGLPSAFRIFLLTLAVIDDLLGIVVIAIFYASGLQIWWLAGSLAAVAVYWLATHRGMNQWWLLIPLGVLAWYCMLQSGVHATIAGVLLGLSVPAKPIGDDELSLAEDMEHDWNAVSQGFALPVFAFFAAGVPIVSEGGSFAESVSDPVFLGAFAGLVLGKPVGIFLTTLLLHRVPGFRLDSLIGMRDVLAVSLLAGIGFTVSLLIGELAFGDRPELVDAAHLGVLFGSVAAALLGAIALRWRAKSHRTDDVAAHDEEFLP